MSQNIFDSSEFPPLTRFSTYWEVLLEEAMHLDNFVFPFDRTDALYEETLTRIIATNRNGWMRGWGEAKDKWINYGLRYKDKLITDFVEDNSCPSIMALVKRLKGVNMVGLSLLKPGGYILPHLHGDLIGTGLLSYHLGLSVPEDWHWLNVEGTFIQHRPGESFVFDASKTHFAINFSGKNRLILYLEFDRNILEFDESEIALELEKTKELYVQNKWQRNWKGFLNRPLKQVV